MLCTHDLWCVSAELIFDLDREYRFPFYSWIRLFFLSYLVLPQTQGARFLYIYYVEPFLDQHEHEIEDLIGRGHERAKALGLQYFYKAIELIREKVLGLPPLHLARTPPPPPATGPAAYAQSLLSRFNLPTSTAGQHSSPTGDVWSRVASAMASAAYAGKSREAQADELSASGIFHPENIASLPRDEKAKLFSSYREGLEFLSSVIAREERKLGADDSDDAETHLAYGSGLEGLRKNASDHSFDHIEHEDARSPSSTGLRDRRSSATPTPSAAGGWTGTWFGDGTMRSTTSQSGVDFAVRSVDEIARASASSSGVDR
jgi:TB2/DP1, HVA22 family